MDDGLAWLLWISAVRGIGFAVLTVLGSVLAGRIVPPERRGEAVGLYGLSVSVPNLVAAQNDDYRFFLRPHLLEGWDTVCYAVPKGRSRA